MKKNKPQHQGSLVEQLKELYYIANKEGLYDAADYIEARLKPIKTQQKLILKKIKKEKRT